MDTRTHAHAQKQAWTYMQKLQKLIAEYAASTRFHSSPWKHQPYKVDMKFDPTKKKKRMLDLATTTITCVCVYYSHSSHMHVASKGHTDKFIKWALDLI
jgi:hypothetical protein